MVVATTTNVNNPKKKRFQSLMKKMEDYKPAWTDIQRLVVPTRGQLDSSSQPQYGKMIDHRVLVDSHATHANRILGSGLNSGMTPKSRPWFRLSLRDRAQLEIPGVRDWLDFVQEQMYAVLDKSNAYGAFQSAYEELGSFGTACYVILEDFEDVIRIRSFTCGEYALGTDSKGRVNAFARNLWMTVGQVVEEFGLKNCSFNVKNKFEQKKVDEPVLICHIIEQNKDRIDGILDAQNMQFSSCYWEATEAGDKYLKESGFEKFPVVAPRWDITTTDMVYGFSPAWDALGYIKELQKTRFDKLLAQEKMHNPPMQQDGSVEGHTDFLPGGVTKTSDSVRDAGVRPAYQINPNLESFLELINEEHEAIDKFFYVNLFLMVANLNETTARTATEIAERQQEKIMMMGPILHRQIDELAEPTLELVFHYMEAAGMVPPPPPGLEGELEIEYISTLAQAQKGLISTQIERLVGYIGLVAQTSIASDQAGIYVFDVDESIREFAENEGIPAKLLKEKEVVAAIADQKAKMAQAQMAAQMAESASKTTKNLGDTPMNTGSALDGLVQPYMRAA